MAYRIAPADGHFLPVREIAAVASEVIAQFLIHRGEADDSANHCGLRIVSRQSANDVPLKHFQGDRAFILEIFDGCTEHGMVEPMRIVAIPSAALYVDFISTAHEAHHTPALRRLADQLGYGVEPVARENYLEAMLLSGATPVAEA